MWEEIGLFIGETIMSAVGSHCLSKKKREEAKNYLDNIVRNKFIQFADTTLDSDDFYKFVKSRRYKELLKNYFWSIKDENTNSEYLDNFENVICKECPNVNPIEVRHFLQEVETIYVDYLKSILDDNPEMRAVYQLLICSHRDIISKVFNTYDNIINYLNSIDRTEIKIDDEMIKEYHNLCNNDFGMIRFTGIEGVEGRKRPQPINKFYVRNTFSFYYYKGGLNDFNYDIDNGITNEIQIEEFFNYGNKIVLIGAAGLGKSTALNYIFCNYEELYNVYALKIKLDLKEYARNINEEARDLLWCITYEFRKRIKRTCVSFDETEKFLANYLNDGKCLIILDALDEIPTQTIRDKVRVCIGDFCEMYYLNKFVISTREVGYLKNRFDDSFLHIRINDFNDGQIYEYSNNWYKIHHDDDAFDGFWDKFKEEVGHARCENLIKNPIVLILALVVFDIGKNLPSKRVEFYKKCIDTFLSVREERKGVAELCERAKDILSMDVVIPRVAFYKYIKIKENVGYKFSYDELKKAVLEAIRVKDQINWREPIKQYTKYLVERTELIREIDEDTLDFAHKTFYEYFLAINISKESKTDDLIDLLNNWIGDANYDELAKLIIEVIIQNNENQHLTRVMEYLLDQNISDDYLERRVKNSLKFYILFDLYKHNMLQPQYQEDYFKIILHNPQYVYQAPIVFRRGNRQRIDSPYYDSKTLASIYFEEVSQGNFAKTINSLYLCDKQFIDQVYEKTTETIIKHIIDIFSIVRALTSPGGWCEKGPKFKKRCEEELKYFTNEGKEYTLKYPQLFLSTVELMVYLNDFNNVRLLFEYSFEGNNYIIMYTTATFLKEFADKINNDKNVFLCFLIVLIECSGNKLNMLFSTLTEQIYLLHTLKKEVEEDPKERERSEMAIWLNSSLKEAGLYTDFQKCLEEAGLYMFEDDYLYQKLYNDYVIKINKNRT